MAKILDFLKNDLIALLGLAVLLGSFVLFFFTLKNLLRSSSGTPAKKDEKITDASGDEEESSLLETYLTSISEDLAEIKKRLSVMESRSSSEAQPSTDKLLDSLKGEIENQVKVLSESGIGSADPAKINKDLQEIKLRLSAIHKIISNLAEQ
jgi:hypothetical protein